MNNARTEVRALRRQIHDWRDGRVDTRIIDVLADAYIAIFATIMLGAMAFNAVRQIRIESTNACASAVCSDARASLPWVFAAGGLAVILLLARLLGPLMATPAEGSWLLSAPADRRILLRPRLARAGILALIAGILIGSVDATIAGFDVSTGVVFAAIIVVGCAGMTMAAALDQARERHIAQFALWLLGAVIWTGLVGVASGRIPAGLPERPHFGPLGLVCWVAVAVATIALAWRAYAALESIRKETVTAGGAFLSSLSGALAGLDLGLVYDILMARKWRSRSIVRPVRGGPAGSWALVWRDVIRLRRSAHTVVVLAATLVVPYVAATLDLGKAVPAVGALTAFLAGLGLCSGLRVLTRTPGLIRCFPMPAASVRQVGLIVPGVVLVIWGLASAPAYVNSMAAGNVSAAVLVGIAVGLAALTAIARWVTAPPPNYSGPLVSSPSGAVPPSLFGNVLRGLDVLLLLTAPLLLASPTLGAQISLALAFIVLTILINRKIPAA